MISSKIGHSLDPAILAVYRFFFRDRTIDPNVLTLCGTFFGFLSAFSTACGFLIPGGTALLLAGFFDLLDGAVARHADRVSSFGGFLDSVLDRYSDLAVMLGIFIFFLNGGERTYAAATFIAAIGIAIIPYARARAEAASISCTTGLMERPERILLLLIGLFFNILQYVVIILAVLSHITVIQRIMYVKRKILQERNTSTKS
ncbi:MAG TPA: CDP-alcohol phosphatidyltransferase family protein [Syntrophorhabdaceae bacterium]|nr:CDP-alcohol phosphatidyltransferase family protein [Syntrophorhabdaceae bacterium]